MRPSKIAWLSQALEDEKAAHEHTKAAVSDAANTIQRRNEEIEKWARAVKARDSSIEQLTTSLRTAEEQCRSLRKIINAMLDQVAPRSMESGWRATYVPSDTAYVADWIGGEDK